MEKNVEIYEFIRRLNAEVCSRGLGGMWTIPMAVMGVENP